MKNSITRYARYALGLLALIFTLSPFLISDESTFISTALANESRTPLAMGLTKGHANIQKVIEVQNRNTERLMSIEGVVGTGIGLGFDGQPAIKVYTVKPGIAGIPKVIEGTLVQVEVTGMIVALADPTARFARPVPIGVSTGHPDITAGTIGARVKDIDNASTSNVYALSNNHVYANSNKANTGDAVLQPGPYDGGTDSADMIGTLHEYEQILFNGSPNTMDAAIALTSIGSLGNSTYYDPNSPYNYGTPTATIVDAFLEQSVQKCGRTTGCTEGTVTGINVTVDVCYEMRGPVKCASSAWFVDQIAISPEGFSDGGDSGSLIVDSYNNPVGLLFAGSSTTTFANPIGLVLDRFDVAIDGDPAEDIEITDIKITEAGNPNIEVSSVIQGDEVDVIVTVENIGSVDVGSASAITVNLETLSSSIDTLAADILGGLMVGYSKEHTFQWSSPSAEAYTLRASHSYVDILGDSNDSKETTLEVTGSTTDIAITSVSADPSSLTVDTAEPTTTVTVQVIVENIGNQDVADGIPVSLVREDTGETIYSPENDSSWTVNLNAGDFSTLEMTWDVPVDAEANFTLTASHSYQDDDFADDPNNNSNSTVVEVTQTASSEIILTVVAKPGRTRANLEWSGAESDYVVIKRDGNQLVTTVNDGSYNDTSVVEGTYVYVVCEADENGSATSICSNSGTVTFN